MLELFTLWFVFFVLLPAYSEYIGEWFERKNWERYVKRFERDD